MSFFGVPLSGLIASQSELQTVSNNLANLDTVGYKDQDSSFSDLFAQSSLTNAANDPIQTGLGVASSQTTTDFSDGSPTATNVSTNMALSGNGLFVLKSSSGTIDYTRAGNFTTNSDGQLTSADGQLVLGYPAVDGVVNTSGALQPLQVGLGSVIPASATTSFQFPANLSATAAVGATFSSPSNVYDSLGTAHVLTVNYTKTGTNKWSYSIDVPTADTGAASSQVATGNLTFDSSGNLTSPAVAPTFTIPSFVDGAASMSLTWNLQSANGTSSVTQTSLASSNGSAIQNGQASGTLTSIAVASDGTVNGTYSNGQTDTLGQVALANFTNTQGLLRTGNNDYQATIGSGQAAIGVAGTGGLGHIQGGYVESSNVDVAAEFAKMIVAQQAYSANAKTVTTFDQVSQATIAMVQA